MGFNKIPDRHTPFYRALMDKKSRELHRRDEQEFSNPAKSQFQGKSEFEGTIMNAPIIVPLPGSPTHKYVICRGRTEDIHGYSVSEPCEFQSGDPTKDAKLYAFIEGCHSENISKIDIDELSVLNLAAGDNVSFNYKEGPAYNGRMRKPTFTPQRTKRKEGFDIAECQARNALVASGGGLLTLGGMAGGGDINNAPTLEFDGPAYEPAIADKLYTPRTKTGGPKGNLYKPSIFTFDSSQRGPDYNGPRTTAGASWQLGGAAYPVHPNRCRVTSAFAKPRGTGPHRGLDLGGGMGAGEPMYAIWEGTIIACDTPNGGGLGGFIILACEAPGKGENGESLFFTLMYAHCDAVYVKKGETVTTGQHICDMGNTGYSFGPHLHLQLTMEAKTRSQTMGNSNATKFGANPIVFFNFKYPYKSAQKDYIEGNNGEQITYSDYQFPGQGTAKTTGQYPPAGQAMGAAGDVPTATELGPNQARYYTERTMEKAKKDIIGIMLHSTDGNNGKTAAQAGITRLAGYPTQSYKVTAKYKTAKVGSPDKSPLVTDGSAEFSTKKAKDYRGKNITIIAKTRWVGGKKQLVWEKLTKISVHYFTDRGGNIVQGVLDKDRAIHGGGFGNKNCIGIEMCGQPNKGAKGKDAKDGTYRLNM